MSQDLASPASLTARIARLDAVNRAHRASTASALSGIQAECQQAARAIVGSSPRLRRGEDRTTVEPYGFPMDVTYEYQEGEAAVLWGNFPHPGSPAHCAVLTCLVGGVDIVDMLNDKQTARIEDAILEGMAE